MNVTTSTSSNFPEPSRRLIRRTYRELPDGTKETIEEYEQGAPSIFLTEPTPPSHTWGRRPHFCPLTDPANAGKAMLYYCPECNGVQC